MKRLLLPYLKRRGITSGKRNWLLDVGSSSATRSYFASLPEDFSGKFVQEYYNCNTRKEKNRNITMLCSGSSV